MTRRAFLWPLFSLLLAALAGCVSRPDSGDDASGKSRSAVEEGMLAGLKSGMTADEVVAHFGQPVRRQAVQESNGQSEIWSYRLDIDIEKREARAPSQDLPYTDPFINQPRTYSGPAYNLETTAAVRWMDLTLTGGHLVSWKVRTEERRTD